MIGDFVSQLPGNQQDLSLVGSRAAFQAPHTVLANTEDWKFLESIGQETGRFDMSGPLPGRYYGTPWLAPQGYLFPNSMVQSDSGIAPNSGSGMSVAGALSPYSDPGVQGGDSSAFAPAADLAQAAASGAPVGPVTLTTPMPSVLQPRHNQVTPSGLSACKLSQWVNDNPLLAVGGVVALFLLMKGGRK